MVFANDFSMPPTSLKPLLAAIILSTPLMAQDQPSLPPMSFPTTRGASPTTAAVAPAAQSSTNTAPQGMLGNIQQQASSMLGSELPFLDPGSEVVSWDGHTWQVTNNRIFGARFEKYLVAPTADRKEDQAYRNTLRQILEELSPHAENKGSLTKAVALLPIAASYYHDARLCESLSNTIYGVWLARRNESQLKSANKELEKQSKAQMWNAGLAAEPNTLRPRGDGSSSRSGSNPQDRRNDSGDEDDNDNDLPDAFSNLVPGNTFPGSGQNPGSADDRRNFQDATWVSYYMKKVAEYEALVAKNKLSVFASEIQQKLEFQGLILQFFVQRRFEHVIIATRLYRKLFIDGDNEMKFDEQSSVFKSFKAGFGFTPTVTTFDTLANEAIRDVDEGVRSFEYLLGKDELESATKRLSEAFAVGEYLPGIRTLPLEKKRQVLEFVRHSNQLLSALDVKNYHLASELVEKLKVIAKDFDYAKAQGLIDATTMTASMLLDKAQLAARSGNEEEMQKNLEQAHALYPTNPELRRVSDLILKGSDTQSQALQDLDRLIAEGNYRAIQKDEARFVAAAGLSNDPKRLEDLMSVRDTLKNLERRIETAKALQDAGSPEAAWETLHEGNEDFGKDPDFAQLYSQLTVKAAKFVHIISEASRHYENDQLGSSLGWYLKARQSHLHSSIAKKAIKDIVDQLLLEQSDNFDSGLEDSF